MSQLLSLRHYHHEQIAHSHDHAQLVFGLSGRLDFEVAGHGCQVSSMSFAVVPPSTHHACASPWVAAAWCSTCRSMVGCSSASATMPTAAGACSIALAGCS